MQRPRATLGSGRSLLQRQAADLETRLAVYHSLWRLGHDCRCQVWTDIAQLLGPRQGRRALKALERYWTLVAGRDETGPGARFCACSAAAVSALIVCRTALGDQATAARLCRYAAPGESVVDVLAAAEAVAEAFLGGDPPDRGHAEAPARQAADADDCLDRRATHRFQRKTLTH